MDPDYRKDMDAYFEKWAPKPVGKKVKVATRETWRKADEPLIAKHEAAELQRWFDR